jgi:hypothetical protein
MKAGKSIVEMAQELTRIRESAKDYVVPTARMEMTTVNWAELTADHHVAPVQVPVLTFQNGEKKNRWPGAPLFQQ